MQLAKYYECTGCTACVNICPQQCIIMKENDEGFLFPQIDSLRCIQCHKCEKVCPILNKIISNENKEVLAYAAYARNDEIRLKSSSGGIFYLIAEKIVELSGVVVGCALNNENCAEHIIIENRNELENILRSKYMQSDLKNIYKKIRAILKENKIVLFCGTPCQIAGLHAFLNYEKFLQLYCIDFVCHGVVSPGFWKIYLRMIEERIGDKSKKIDFRNKETGWRGYQLCIEGESGKKYCCKQQEDAYMQLFLKNISLRLSCYCCKFKGLSRQSDITLADFWAIQNVFPEMDDNKGISLVMIHSNKGRKLFSLINKDICEKKVVDISKAVSKKGPAMGSVKYNKKRTKFFLLLKKKQYEKAIEKSLKDTMFERISNIIRYYKNIFVEIIFGGLHK